MSHDTTSVDPAEIAKFESLSEEWWDPAGPFRPLHLMNPVRLDYITRQLAAEFDRDPGAAQPLEGLSLLDIGCGGGLLAEPLARLGGAVTGIDAGGAAVPVARAHAARSGLEIDYRHQSAEALAGEGAQFDAVFAMEVVEHVSDPAAFLTVAARLVRPGGLLIVSTLNRTAKSFAAAIVGAELILRWLPRGTHDWRKFPRPAELAGWLEGAGCAVLDRTGMVYDPLRGLWHLSPDDLSVNYVMLARRPDPHADPQGFQAS